MRKIIYILILLIYTACGEVNSSNKNTDVLPMKENTVNLEIEKNDTSKLRKIITLSTQKNDYNPDEFRKESLKRSFEEVILFKLTDTIKADFNGDGIIDEAVFIKDNEASGIIIRHGKTHEEVKIGFGNKFAHFKDLNWVDYWGLVKDKETAQTIFNKEGDVITTKNVKLQNPSILLGKDEVGGGLITFLKGKYIWIHQTC